MEGHCGAVFVRYWYEEDKFIPINPGKNLKLNQEKLATYRDGSKCLSYCHELTMSIEYYYM